MNPRLQTAEERLSHYRELVEEARRCAACAKANGEASLAIAWEEFAAEVNRLLAEEAGP